MMAGPAPKAPLTRRRNREEAEDESAYKHVNSMKTSSEAHFFYGQVKLNKDTYSGPYRATAKEASFDVRTPSLLLLLRPLFPASTSTLL